MKSSKRILALLLAIVFIAGAAPPAFAAAGDPGEDSSGGAAGLCLVEDAAGLAAPTALTPDYTLNGADGGWADGEIKLDDAGDELILLADSGPLAPVKISVTAPSGSSVTITGRVGVTYENLYMEVLSDNLTLYLENLAIKAPEGKWGGNNGYRGLQFKSDTDYACITISAEGNCVIEGGDYLTASGGGGYGGAGYSSSIKTGPSVKGLTLHTAGDGQIQFIGGDGKWAGLGVNTPGAIIEADTVAQAGNAEATESSSGMQISGDLTIKNKLSVYGGGVAAADVNGGTGLVFGDGGSLTFESGGSLEARGGDGKNGGMGFLSNSKDTLQLQNAVIKASGGEGLAGNGGVGIVLYDFYSGKTGDGLVIDNSTIEAEGGDGTVNGAHAIMVYSGTVEVKNGANVTAIGGDGGANLGGVGIRAFGATDDSLSTYHGNMVSIANNAGNVYVRGGVGAAGQRASVMGDKIYIATGNVGNIAFEASAPNQEHKNVAGGDDVHMLTVNTSPAAAVSIGATVTTTAPGLSPSYSYSALTETDGVACLWLPAGSQTVSANGYNSASGTIENTNTALVTLTQKQAGGGGSSAPTYSANVSSGGTLPVTVNQASGSASVTANAALGESVLGGGNEVITMPAIAGVTSYSLGIPVAYLSTPGGGTLTFSTDTGSMTLPADMLSGVPGAEGKKAAITIGAGDKAGLSEEAKSAIGARPLITLSLMLDGVQADWSNPGAPVSVSIPYTPTAAELENPESIILWYIDGAGNLSCIPNGRFDPATGRVTFSVTHFSLYAVGYNSVRFSDVTEGAWYADAVNFIAARGITGGTGGGSFSPEAKLTRGQFIIMLLRACEIAPDANPSDNFSDAGNTYYTGYLAAAKRLGISAGVGDNKFAPEKELTRQEMFTLLHNALKALGQLPQGESGKKLSDFPDGGEIADWAKAAMGLLVEAGTVDGRSGRLNPAGTMTRAEMAQVLYKLLSK